MVFAAPVVGIIRGGTGTSTPPTYGKVMVGNSSGGWDYKATSTIGLAPGSIFADNNTWTGLNIFANSTSTLGTIDTFWSTTASLTNATTTSLGITGLATPSGTLLAVDASGNVIATSSVSLTPWVENIDAGGYNLTDVGDLGIGTSTPVNALDIWAGNLGFWSGDPDDYFLIFNGGSELNFADPLGTNILQLTSTEIGLGSDGGFAGQMQIGSPNTTYIGLFTDGTAIEANAGLTITPGGVLTVGTTSPITNSKGKDSTLTLYNPDNISSISMWGLRSGCPGCQNGTYEISVDAGGMQFYYNEDLGSDPLNASFSFTNNTDTLFSFYGSGAFYNGSSNTDTNYIYGDLELANGLYVVGDGASTGGLLLGSGSNDWQYIYNDGNNMRLSTTWGAGSNGFEFYTAEGEAEEYLIMDLYKDTITAYSTTTLSGPNNYVNNLTESGTVWASSTVNTEEQMLPEDVEHGLWEYTPNTDSVTLYLPAVSELPATFIPTAGDRRLLQIFNATTTSGITVALDPNGDTDWVGSSNLSARDTEIMQTFYVTRLSDGRIYIEGLTP